MNDYEFVEAANPHSWFMVSEDLHCQAALLRNNFGRGELKIVNYKTKERTTWDIANRSTFLLASFALENMIKGFLVYENPSWVSNGRISKNLKSHSLTKLASQSNLLPYKKNGHNTLLAFEEGNESWARYPCSLRKEETKSPSILTETLWKKYIWLIRAYEKRLRKLLSKNWSGPHGFVGRYRITGEFFSAPA